MVLKFDFQAVYTLPIVLWNILPENSVNQLILAHLRQVVAEGQLRDLRRPKQDDMLAKQHLVLERMLERAETEANILRPLRANRWRVDTSASAEPRPLWMEDPNNLLTSASQSEGYSSYPEHILEHRCGTPLGCGTW
jgi:hypothetical protein